MPSSGPRASRDARLGDLSLGECTLRGVADVGVDCLVELCSALEADASELDRGELLRLDERRGLGDGEVLGHHTPSGLKASGRNT